MNKRISTFTIAVLVSLAGACGDGTGNEGDDAGMSTPIDANVPPGTDAWSPDLPDAWSPPGDDAWVMIMDPLDAAPTCTSGTMWTRGNRGSANMNPGMACNECHARMAPRRVFTIAGTVYPTGHEPDTCNGAPGTTDGGLVVEITDATGAVVRMTPNSVGNFSSTTRVTFPITAAVRSGVASRAMHGTIMTGDCNTCHTQTGDMSAPGRITIPVAGLPATP
ncbi:MAG: hypothetical protein U0353_04465 [Sandaracinus sp.]|jgi:hypothetical protein